MTLKESVIKGVTPAPRRVLVYGIQGAGKSSYAAASEKPIFIQTEDGLNDIDCAKFPLSDSFDDVMQRLTLLYIEEHDYKTVVIDSLDWLEKLIWEEVCRQKNVDHIEDIPYAKGYAFAMNHWRSVLEALNALRRDKKMTVVLIAHSKIERFANPETESYDRYSPNLHRSAAATVMEWCDEVLFTTYTVHTKHCEEGFNKKRVQAIGTGERVLRTTERPTYLAKNRLNLPDELPLNWESFSNFFTFKGEVNHG